MLHCFVKKLFNNVWRLKFITINELEICQPYKTKLKIFIMRASIRLLYSRNSVEQQNVGITPHYQIRKYFEACSVNCCQYIRALFHYLSIRQSWANSSIFMLTYGQRVIFKVQPSWKSESRTVCLQNYFSSSQRIRWHNFHLHVLPHILHTILYNNFPP